MSCKDCTCNKEEVKDCFNCIHCELEAHKQPCFYCISGSHFETKKRRKISEINKDIDKLENFELTDEDIKELNESMLGANHIQMSDVTIDTGETQSHPDGFTKHDDGKLRYDLVPPFALEKVVKILTMGSLKYDDNNWIKCDSYQRYYAAAQRHLNAWQRGEDIDDESGESHLSHAICCLMFLMELEEVKPEADDRYKR